MNNQEKDLLFSLIDIHDNDRQRKIIFWYDEKRDYEEIVSSEEFLNELEEKNTELIKFDNNSIWIRYYIEMKKFDKNIIIYIPYPEKNNIENPLLDLEMENKNYIFSPDRTSILLKEYGLSSNCRDIIKKYERFFKDKVRRSKFEEFEIQEKNESNIDLIITAILLNIKTINAKSVDSDEILKNLMKCFYEDQKRYDELVKFGSEEFIIELINTTFGSKISSYNDLEELFKSLVITYFANSFDNMKIVDKYSKYILKSKITNVQVFVNSLMRDSITKNIFEKISENVSKEFGIDRILDKVEIEKYKYADAFEIIDINILKFISSNVSISLGESNIYKSLISIRESLYWYEHYKNEYSFLKNAISYFEKIEIIQDLIKTVDFEHFIKLYTEYLYEVDSLYRKIYYYFDKIKDKDDFIELQEKIENNYINNYMMNLSIKWNEVIKNVERYNATKLVMQHKFYDNFIKPYIDKAGRIIVIISDAFRYECAKELNDKLKIFSEKSEIVYMQGNIPSYTKLGMASLLPNKKLSRVEKSDDILVDGESSSSTKEREKILRKNVDESMAIQYDELRTMKKGDWKKLFSGKKLVYIYHNTIDKVGEHNENKIFEACEEAINELEEIIKDLHTTFSGVNLFVTSDHGFFYKRGKIQTFEKTKKDENAIIQKTRYSYTENKSNEEGVVSINVDYIFEGEKGYVTIPKGHNIFSRQGIGTNYLHGGILPQEIIIPVIDFKSSRTTEESKKVGITYSGLSTKITKPIVYLEFLQDSNVDENNLPCRYLLHFEDEFGNRISDECTIVAQYKNTDVKDRFFNEKFVFKNIKYDKNKNYYLVIKDEDEKNISNMKKIRFVLDISSSEFLI